MRSPVFTGCGCDTVDTKTRAAAIERESKALEANPNLIQLRIAERWNGALPMYTGNSIPMLQLPTNKP